MLQNADGWTDWEEIPTSGKFALACCDCGLVHNMVFRVVKSRVQFKAHRNARSTAAHRRWKRERGEL